MSPNLESIISARDNWLNIRYRASAYHELTSRECNARRQSFNSDVTNDILMIGPRIPIKDFERWK